MSRRWRALCIAVAWVAPLLWLAFLLSGPSDGAVASAPGAVLGDGRWSTTVRVLDTYGDTPLDEGDLILAVDGVDIADAIAGRDLADHRAGDQVTYSVRRLVGGIPVDTEVVVPLRGYPLLDAVAENLHLLVIALGLLSAGSFLLWRRGTLHLAVGTLVGGAALFAGLSAHPWGAQPLELAGRAPLWPHAVGEALIALGLGAVVAALWGFPRPPVRVRGARLAGLAALPGAGYAAWLAGYAWRQPQPARLQAELDVALAALTVAVALAVPALATGFLRADSVAERVAARLMVLAISTAVFVGLVLATVPDLLRGEPLLPWEVLTLVLAPVVLACWVSAVLGYRLVEIDATLRRSLLQLVLATVVGALFLGVANAVNLAAGTSVGSMVTGGVVALVMLPAGLLLWRTASRLLYGGRANPYRVVSELRRLEPTTAPEDALREMLELLRRSLRLDYAAIRAEAEAPEGSFLVSVGERRGDPTTVDLEAAGRRLGQLELEVGPLRDPFGPRDRRLLEDVGSQVGALVQALSGSRQLRRSREQLVAAREEERRRLRRDLHDGLGPSLATMLMRLEVARDLVARDPDEAGLLLSRLMDQAEADVAEIRRLVDGLRPPALDQLGLVSALRQRADEHNHTVALGASGAPTWSVVADDLGPLPAAVEVAAYRIAVEAVNNAVRHSRASSCLVTLRRGDAALSLRIRDDGTGMADGTGAGVGVGSMRDRAEELGGTCTVESDPGGGTVVSAHLPLPAVTPEEDEEA